MRGKKDRDFSEKMRLGVNIGFLAWLELLLESGPPGPKRVPHGRTVKQTNKQISVPPPP